MVQAYHETFYTLYHTESKKKKFQVLTDTILGVILYSEVILHQQISTLAITEFFLTI